ncbi:MAG: A/G-specific adenine glycosylase [Bacteroidales bacterium]|nr:A/G-specific adenine glycosylase [Bacteroidales bacterium]
MLKDFGPRIVKWYDKNKRELPWRNSTNPYKIWLSEIILQQTRVEQGLGYYLKFIRRFPDIYSLAEASQTEVYKMWQGLGYYNRADNLMAAAQTIVRQYKGLFPETPEALIRIQGIGPYTSAAIASIAFGYPKPVVDGNVYRVLSRLFGIETPINTGRAKKEFETLAGNLLQGNPPAAFNQAMMEFGALHCKPVNPDCLHCIFLSECTAGRLGEVARFPVKKKKPGVRKRYFYYLLVEVPGNKSNAFFLKQRDKKDIWKNLYDFPLLECNKRENPAEVLKNPVFEHLIGQTNFNIKSVSNEYRHQLTHQKIHAVFIHLIVNKNTGQLSDNSVFLVDENKLITYPVPRLLERYLQDQKILK